MAPTRPRPDRSALALLALGAVLACGLLLHDAGPALLAADPPTPSPATAGRGTGVAEVSRGAARQPGGPTAPVSGSGRDLNWAALAECESDGDPRAVSSDGYFGLYQLSRSDWRSVGGVGNPARASERNQTRRARLLYQRHGTSLWPVCGRYL